jgi:beta-1,4-mannosyl-glycoprotein beta-1,4-N-acetylglucosaminyltransferase
MKIIDAFTFFNEIDLLKIRLEYLHQHVDHFIICESNVTHSGAPKSWNFLDHSKDFEAYKDKIIYAQYTPSISEYDFTKKDEVFNENAASWKLERGQRNYISNFLKGFDSEDVVIVSDADEIWNPELANLIRSNPQIEMARLELQFNYYYLNCRGIGKLNNVWTSSYLTKLSKLGNNLDLSKIRTQEALPTIANAGWHFSYLGGIDAIIHKIESFAHQELNFDSIKDRARLQACLERGLDFLNRPGHEWAFHPIDYYPPDLGLLMRKNMHLARTDLK